MNLSKLVFALLILVGLTGCECCKPNEPVSLYDGHSLEGWTQRGGAARYHVWFKTIRGTTWPGTPNTFLCTDQAYGDFELEFDVLCDPALNSGVQIRSAQYAEDTEMIMLTGQKRVHEAGRVRGYQVEISNEETGTSGGIYDEARRGWLDNISEDAAASGAFKDNEWNHYKIRAVGERLQVWVNGVPCADVTDGVDRSGFIGLQVHGIGNKPGPYSVYWRNLMIKEIGKG